MFLFNDNLKIYVFKNGEFQKSADKWVSYFKITSGESLTNNDQLALIT